MQVRLGINPLTWSNDDLRALGRDIPLATCLREAAAAGYAGVAPVVSAIIVLLTLAFYIGLAQ